MVAWLLIWFSSDHDRKQVKEFLSMPVNELFDPDLFHNLRVFYGIFAVLLLIQCILWIARRKLQKYIDKAQVSK